MILVDDYWLDNINVGGAACLANFPSELGFFNTENHRDPRPAAMFRASGWDEQIRDRVAHGFKHGSLFEWDFAQLDGVLSIFINKPRHRVVLSLQRVLLYVMYNFLREKEKGAIVGKSEIQFIAEVKYQSRTLSLTVLSK